MEFVHVPVLKDEVLANCNLDAEKETSMVDCTTGEGGHTHMMLSHFPKLHVTGLDRDPEIQKKAIYRMQEFGDRFTPVLTWFNDYFAEERDEKYDLILFDLGISVFHYEESSRGFSFRKDEELDMRLDSNSPVSAETVVNTYREEDLADVIYRYGEERYSRRIARAICERRREKAITRSDELADIIYGCVPAQYRHGHLHPATRTFQALRIEVNRELDRIDPAVRGAIKNLRKGGRVCVITFHSLEDRIVKWLFRELADDREKEAEIRIITKKPIIPTDEECRNNPPSRSAKLRIAEKL